MGVNEINSITSFLGLTSHSSQGNRSQYISSVSNPELLQRLNAMDCERPPVHKGYGSEVGNGFDSYDWLAKFGM